MFEFYRNIGNSTSAMSTLLTDLSPLKAFLKLDHVCIDNLVFRMHYKVTLNCKFNLEAYCSHIPIVLPNYNHCLTTRQPSFSSFSALWR